MRQLSYFPHTAMNAPAAISRYYAYHGTTLATLDAGGMGERKAKFEPYSGDFAHVPPPYCYRCPFGLSYPSCGLACVKAMETARRTYWLRNTGRTARTAVARTRGGFHAHAMTTSCR
jgi:4-aminobutyrate aminotransferase-like enzyme